MVKRLFFLLMIFVGSTTLAQAQNLSAFVDRTDISLNDVFTLTLRIDARLGNVTPSFTGLDRDFEQLGISRANNYSNNNGDIQSWNEYRVSLKPKSIGQLTIPSFRVGGEVTTPITIMVADAPQTGGSGNNEIFINTSVSKNDSYVQEQLLYTIKLYYTIGFDQGAQLTSPNVENAVVQQLGSDETYQEIIDGIRYNVTERKFVIFPQSSGELTIPPIFFSATLGRRGGLSRILSNRSNVREVNLSSESHVVNVMPVPASFPGSEWLPSANFTIEETWSSALDTIAVGESITRNIIIASLGLSSSLLPDLNYTDITNLKFYPDQAVREDIADSNGVTGMRSEGTAIVPSADGEFILPAIEIPWWNTVTDSLEIAIIPSRTLSVLPGNINTNSAPPPINFGNNSAQLNIDNINNNQNSGLSPLWLALTAFFAAAWLFSTTMWLRNRRMLDQQTETLGFTPVPLAARDLNIREAVKTDTAHLPELKTSYRLLQNACKQDNLSLIKRSLLSWGQAFYQNKSIITLDKLDHFAENTDLANLMSTLEKSLYSGEAGSSNFSSEALLATVSEIQKTGKKKPSKTGTDYSLPPLYKN